jgi:phosphoribosylamine--glycine ligase
MVYGNGGRERALGWKFQQSPHLGRLSLGVPGVTTVAASVEYAEREGVDLVVVGPDNALADGMVDQLAARGIAAFGPTQEAARLEWDKAFAKQIAIEAGIPTADFRILDNPRAAHAYIDARAVESSVVKATGLALGKGVEVCPTREAAHRFIHDLMVRQIFGAAGLRVVIEDKLEPPEFSMHALVANGVAEPFISAEDHKQEGDGDTGKNTGGMGVRTPVPNLPQRAVNRLHNSLLMPALRVMERRGTPVRGTIFTGGMDEKLLEYNARFGDPETQAYVRLMKSDLLRLIVDCMNNQLRPGSLEWNNEHAICIVAASDGYPGKYQTGLEIQGVQEASEQEGVVVFPAGVAQQDGKLYTAGGRVLNITATGKTPEQAYERGYAAIRHIRFGGSHHNVKYRTDIGRRPAA